MKARIQSKAKGTTRVNTQQVVYELKRRVLLALNKVADRDTYQIGIEELEKMVVCLNQEGLSPFLSCILDTSSEQKSAVRKECIRLLGTLANFHTDRISPHLGKMIASIVKRLKDPDSVVRDACVEAVGILALKLGNDGAEGDGVFVVLVKPLFEALGEQNKQVQSGAALCLARMIGNIHNPPTAILQRMLSKTIKMLKNPHFMAKPAVIELNSAIIQGGGAPGPNILSLALTSIQEALKDCDWTTRKAASVALGAIASSGNDSFGPFKASCISSLESCRFDKVKPVRESVVQALNLWRNFSESYSLESLQVESSIKESSCDRSSDNTHRFVQINSNRPKHPPTNRLLYRNYMTDAQNPKTDDWQVEIAVPKTRDPSFGLTNREFECSSATKTMEETAYDYVNMDDKQDYSSVSNQADDNYDTKSIACGLAKPMGAEQRYSSEECSGDQICSVKMHDRRSLDSTVTDYNSPTVQECCLQTMNEVILIRKQLLEIENKQSELKDLLQAFTNSTVGSLSTIQTKVSSLELVVDKIATTLTREGKHSDSAIPQIQKEGQRSTSRQLPVSTKTADIWEEKTSTRSSRACNHVKKNVEMWLDPATEVIKDFKGNRIRKADAISLPLSNGWLTQDGSESKSIFWKRAMSLLCVGDIESAYVEVLRSGDELLLIDIVDRTGPALDRLSNQTAASLLEVFVLFLLEERGINSIIPWLQQLVDLCTIHGPSYLNLSAKERQNFLSMIQEAAEINYSNATERRSVSQIATKLHKVWGKS